MKKSKKKTIIEHYEWEFEWELDEDDIFDFDDKLIDEDNPIIELEEIYSGYMKDDK